MHAVEPILFETLQIQAASKPIFLGSDAALKVKKI
jgi:hypothetical protein